MVKTDVKSLAESNDDIMERLAALKHFKKFQKKSKKKSKKKIEKKNRKKKKSKVWAYRPGERLGRPRQAEYQSLEDFQKTVKGKYLGKQAEYRKKVRKVQKEWEKRHGKSYPQRQGQALRTVDAYFAQLDTPPKTHALATQLVSGYLKTAKKRVFKKKVKKKKITEKPKKSEKIKKEIKKKE